MQYKEKEIKKGIKLHEIQTDKFKTNLIAVFLTNYSSIFIILLLITFSVYLI